MAIKYMPRYFTALMTHLARVLAVTFSIVFSTSVVGSPAHAYIENLLIEEPPVPTPRPSTNTRALPLKNDILSVPPPRATSPLGGSLKLGLEAIGDRNIKKALGIRESLQPGSLDRKILAWAIALSSRERAHPGEIAAIAKALPNWPGQKAMRINAERSLADLSLPSSNVIKAFSSVNKPETIEGAISLASAYLKTGDRKSAREAILPYWLNERLNQKTEKEILERFGALLQVSDHRHRMHQLFYNGRIREAERMGALAKQFSLSKAWAAVLRQSANADKLVNAVAAASKKDVAYQFVRIEHLRRQGKYRQAANLLINAPNDARLLVDPDEWWNERRIISREMLELGDARTAYRIASRHSARSPAKIAEAEFHAGWYALRFLKEPATARRHFTRILEVAKQPISQSRGHYWLARASSGGAARHHFREAAKHTGTYYGQLALAKIGKRNLTIIRPRPTANERKLYKSRELVRAIARLNELGYGWRADSMYRHLARELQSPGELALLAAEAERVGDFTLALQIGKLANARGLAVDTLAWPIGAIPASAKTGRAGLPLAYAIARQESAFDVDAHSSADARGLLQLLPGTAKAVARRLGLKYSSRRLSNDGGYNVTLGSAYLAEQLEEFSGSYILTFAAYNAGPRRAREWVARFGDPQQMKLEAVIDWVELISFTETRNYVQRVMENYQVYKARIDSKRLTIAEDLVKGRR